MRNRCIRDEKDREGFVETCLDILLDHVLMVIHVDKEIMNDRMI